MKSDCLGKPSPGVQPVHVDVSVRVASCAMRLFLIWCALLVLVLVLVHGAPATAQLSATAIKSDNAASAPADLYGRDTPRGLVDGLIGALAARDYERASQYFDLSAVPASKRGTQGIEIAQKLQAALDAGGSLIQPVALSNEASGRIDDQLPIDQERIGTLPAPPGGEDLPLIAVSSSPSGKPIWRISSESLAQLKAIAPGTRESNALRDRLPPVLRQTSVGGAPLGDWLILLGAALIYYLVVRAILRIGLALLVRFHPLKRDSWGCRLLENAPGPLSLWISMLLFLGTTRTFEAAIVARQFANRIAGALAFLAFTWLLWRVIDVAAELVAKRMARVERYRARSIIIFMRRALKLLLLMFAAVQALNILGIDVTTGIAALGLGGLAIALGAQKTVENVVGSVSVVVDEPVRVGDFCKVGDVSGTVEEIGIRSTRIRTNDRTRVTIPNSNFAALQIENFSDRDRFLFNPILQLSRDLDADGIERVLEALRAALGEADYLYEGTRANFKAIGESSFDIEIFGWINVRDGNEAIRLQEKLLLEVMRRIQGAGARFAVPARAVEMARADATRSGVEDVTMPEANGPRS
jgi:MscS family membrane protein